MNDGTVTLKLVATLNPGIVSKGGERRSGYAQYSKGTKKR
jgi:hypothetical protein